MSPVFNSRLTPRPNTEPPITITQGTNQLCSLSDVDEQAGQSLKKKMRDQKIPDLWDGQTAGRVVTSLKKHCFGAID